MAKLDYFIVCRSVSVDLDTDELTLSHVLEDVFPEEFPTFLPKVVAVSSWNGTPDDANKDFQTILQVRLPGEANPVQFSMNLATRGLRFRAIQGLLNVPLTGPGDFKLEILLNGAYAASHTITVHRPDVRGREDQASENMPNGSTSNQPSPA